MGTIAPSWPVSSPRPITRWQSSEAGRITYPAPAGDPTPIVTADLPAFASHNASLRQINAPSPVDGSGEVTLNAHNYTYDAANSFLYDIQGSESFPDRFMVWREPNGKRYFAAASNDRITIVDIADSTQRRTTFFGVRGGNVRAIFRVGNDIYILKNSFSNHIIKCTVRPPSLVATNIQTITNESTDIEYFLGGWIYNGVWYVINWNQDIGAITPDGPPTASSGFRRIARYSGIPSPIRNSRIVTFDGQALVAYDQNRFWGYHPATLVSDLTRRSAAFTVSDVTPSSDVSAATLSNLQFLNYDPGSARYYMMLRRRFRGAEYRVTALRRQSASLVYPYVVGAVTTTSYASNTLNITSTVGASQTADLPVLTSAGAVSTVITGDDLPSGVTFDTTRRRFTLNPGVGTEGTYTFTVTSSTTLGGSDTVTVTLVIGQALTRPAFTPGSATRTVQAGQTLTFVLNPPTGFPTPTVAVGTLPPNATYVAATRTLTVPTTTAGTLSVVWTASNTAGLGTGTFTLTINVVAVSRPAFATPSLPDLTVVRGGPIDFTWPSVSSGTATSYTFNDGNSGVSFNPATLRTTGDAPQVLGDYTMTLTAVNATLGNATMTRKLTVVAAIAPEWDDPSLPPFDFVDELFSRFPVKRLDRGSEPVTYEYIGPSLPEGVVFDARRVEFYGIPPALDNTVPTTIIEGFVQGTNEADSDRIAVTLRFNRVSTLPAWDSFPGAKKFIINGEQTRLGFDVVDSGLPTPSYSLDGLPNGFAPTADGLFADGSIQENQAGTIEQTAVNPVGPQTRFYEWESGDAAAPSWTNPSPPFTFQEGKYYFLPVVDGATGGDAFGNPDIGFPPPETQRFENLPSGFSFDRANKAVLGWFDASNSANGVITQFSRNQFGTAQRTYSWTKTTAAQPALWLDTDQIVSVRGGRAHTVSVRRPSQANPIPTYTATGLATGITFDATNLELDVAATAAPGTYSITIVPSGSTSRLTVLLTVLPVAPGWRESDATGSMDSGTTGRFVVPEVDFGYPAPSYTAGVLPSGVVFDASTRTFTVTRTSPGDIALTCKATGFDEQEATYTITVSINSVAPSWS